MADNFGLYLKHERELRGVPLEEIAGATKIHIRFLKALEDNQLEELPGEVFIKGYIRSYARAIGSDIDEVLNTYDQLVTKNPEKTFTQKSSAQADNAQEAEEKNLAGIIVLSVFLVALVVGGYFLVNKVFLAKSNGGETTRAVVNKPPQVIEDDLLPDAEVLPDVSVEGALVAEEPKSEVPGSPNNKNTADVGDASPLPAETAKVEPAPQPSVAIVPKPPVVVPDASSGALSVKDEPLAHEERMKLVIKTSQDSWFNMTVDDFREEDFILPAGTGKTFYGNEKFRITIGNRSGTELNLNGKNLVLPEAEGNVVKDFIINPQNTE